MSKAYAKTRAEEKKKSSSASSQQSSYEKSVQIYNQQKEQDVQAAKRAAENFTRASTYNQYSSNLRAYMDRLNALRGYGYDTSTPIAQVQQEIKRIQPDLQQENRYMQALQEQRELEKRKKAARNSQPWAVRVGLVNPNEAEMTFGVYDPSASERGRVSNVLAAGGKGWLAGQQNALGFALDPSQPDEAEMFFGKAPTSKLGEKISGKINEALFNQSQRLYGASDELNRQALEHETAAKQGLGKFGQTLVDTGMAGTQMLLDASIGRATGTGMASMGTRTFGQSAREALDSGATYQQAMDYGALSAAVELGTEKMFDVAKIFGGGGLDKTIEKWIVKYAKTPAGMTILRTIAGASGEGLEEIVSSAVNPLLRSGYDPDALKDYGTSEYWADMLHEGLVGALLGGIGVAGNVITGGNARMVNEVNQEALNARLQRADAFNAAQRKLFAGNTMQTGTADAEAARILNRNSGTQGARDVATVRRAAQEQYGAQAKAVESVFEAGTADAETFQRQFQTAYDLGKEGAALDVAMNTPATADLNELQRENAWAIGRDVGIREGIIKEEANENGETVRVRGSGERDAGQSAAGSVQQVEENAGSYQEGRSLGIGRSAKDSAAADLRYSEEVKSARDLGIENGAVIKNLRTVDESSYTPEMNQYAQEMAETGHKVTYVSGLIHAQDGPGGMITRARGMVNANGDVLIQVDNERFTAMQIGRHEDGHLRIDRGEIDLAATKDAVRESMGQERFDRAMQDYAEAYAGLDMTEDEIWEEIVCDAQGEMNIFEGTLMQNAEQRASNLIRETKAQTTAGETTQERAPPEGEQKMSAEVTEREERAAESVGVEIDAETESANPGEVFFSRETWDASEYVQRRDAAVSALVKSLGVSEAQAEKYIDDVNSVAYMIANEKGRLDYEATGMSPFVSNSEYGGSFDFTTLCKKRRLITGTFSAIQNALPNTALTPLEILEIRRMMDEQGLEVNCGKCYVEGSRAAMGKFTKEFLRLYAKYHPGKFVPNMAQMNTPDGVEWVRQNHPEVYSEYLAFWNNHGKLRDGDPNLFASQQKPKLYQMRSAYDGEILKAFKGDKKIKEKNDNGGLRVQSFSDFEIVHLIDMMQVIMDASREGLYMQGYTKVQDFARAFGNTGLKINLSIDAWGVDENGKLIFNDKEGMPTKDAFELREKYSENVGTICCVYDDAQLLAALADPRIDFIIPFHRSQWKKSQYKAMGMPKTTKDYTYQQNEKWLHPEKHTHEYRGRQVQTKCTNFMPNTYWEYNHDGKWNAEKYLRMCAEAGKRPKFYKLLVNNGDGSYSLQPDGSTDGYWKLLIDFKMYDNEGNGAKQRAVRPDFNMDEINRMLKSYEGGHNRFPVAQGIVDEFVAKYKAEHKWQKFSRELDDRYMQAVESGDTEKAQRMVDEAARAAGYDTPKLYHGTPKFGFTKFKRGEIFLTSSPNVAEGYGRKTKPAVLRQISDADAGFSPGSYSVYANLGDNPLIIEGNGRFWAHLSMPDELSDGWRSGQTNTRNIADRAKKAGYTAVVFKDIYDPGENASASFSQKSDVYVLFDSADVKSADPVTYDDDGNIIPLSERFNSEKTDIRYSRETDLDQLARENRALQKETDELRKAVQKWRGETKRTTRFTLREDDVKREAKQIVKDYNSTADAESVAQKLHQLGELILNGENGDTAYWTDVRTLAEDIAQEVVNAETVNAESVNIDASEETSANYEAAVTWAANDVIDRVLDESIRQNPKTFADRAQEKLERAVEKERNKADLRVAQAEERGARNVERAKYEMAFRDNEALRKEKERGEKRLNEQRNRFNERIERVRAQGNERVERTKREYAERSRKAIERMQARQEKQIADLKAKQKAKEQGARDRKNTRAVWHKIERLGIQFRQMAEKPSQAASKHAPIRLARALQGVAESFRFENRRMVPARLDKVFKELQVAYQAMEDENDPNHIYYDKDLYSALVAVKTDVEGYATTGLTGIDQQQLQSIYNLLRMFEHTITNANKFVHGQWLIGKIEAGRKFAREIADAAPLFKKGVAGRVLNLQLRPDSFFARLSGFSKNGVGEQIQKMFVEGEERMLRIQQDAYQHFSKFTESKEFAKLSSHKKGDLVDVGLKSEDGKPILLTRDLMLAVYMHLRSEDNLMGAAYGGFDVPDVVRYYRGDTSESFTDGVRTSSIDERVYELREQLRDLRHQAAELDTINEANAENIWEKREQIEQKIIELQSEIQEHEGEMIGTLMDVRERIGKMLTQYERDLIDATDAWMQKSADYINEETRAMYGIEKANVEHYWPIHRNKAFVNTELRDVVNEVNLENVGFLKERVKSHAPVMLTGLAFELDNHTRRMSQFCGFAAAQRDFQQIYDTRLPGMHSSLAEQIDKKFGGDMKKLGTSGREYIEKYINDISGAKSTEKRSPLAPIRQNLARATLSVNFRVAMSQVASIPTAAAEVGWGAMAKGYFRSSVKGLSAKQQAKLAAADPWFWQRSRGEGGMREFAEMRESNNALDRGYNKIAGTKVGKAILNWCQRFDMYATYSQWTMAEEWVKKHTDFKPDTEEFDSAVSAKYRDIIRKTQPNYTVTERSDLLRDKRESMKWATMYKTQSNQNLNILYEATARLHQYNRDLKAGKNGVTEEDVREARRAFANAYTGVILGGTVSFVLFRAFANAVIHAMNGYRDDDDELTVESFLKGVEKETFGAMAGMFVLGSEIYDAVYALVTKGKYWGLTDSAVGALDDVLQQAVKVAQKVGTDDPPSRDDWTKLANSIMAPLGIPGKNAAQIVTGIVNHIEDIQNGEFLSFEAGVHRTASQETNRILNGYLTGAGDKAKRAWDELLKLKDGDEGKAQSTMKSAIRDAFLENRVTDKQAQDMLKRYAGMKADDAAEYLLQQRCEKETGLKFSEIKEAYLNGDISAEKAISMKQKYGGMDADKAKEAVGAWLSEKETGIAVDDIKDAYLDGDISRQQAIDMRVKYAGKTQEDAENEALKWDVYKQYGIEYSIGNVQEALSNGEISEASAKEIWTKYGGKTEEDADELVKAANFKKAHPDVDLENVTSMRVDIYNQYAPKGTDAAKFMEYAAQIKKDQNAGKYPGIPDGKGGKKPYSVMDEVARWINSLPITSGEKTALLLTYTNGKTTSLSRYTWS